MVDLFMRPFRSDSIWNAPIPEDAHYEHVPKLPGLDVGFSSWLIPDGSSVPLYRARTTDRILPIFYNRHTWDRLYNGSWRQINNPREVERQIIATSSPRFPLPYHPYVSQDKDKLQVPSTYDPIVNPAQVPARARFPTDVHPTWSADGHMVVFQPDGKALETYATIILSDGAVVCLSYKFTDPSLDGDGVQNGITASMIPVYAGLVREYEVAGGAIDHAIKVVAPAALLEPSFVYPALAFDRGATREDPPYSGTVPMGAQLAIPRSISLTALGLQTELGRMTARAAQTYGFIVTDRGGGGVTIMTEYGVRTPALEHWDATAQQDLGRILAVMQRVIRETIAPPRRRR